MTARGSAAQPTRPAGLGWIAAGVALAAGLLYLPALGNGFVNWDDVDYVTGNLRVQGPFDAGFVAWAFTSFLHSWHPLTWLSLGLDHTLFGLDPRGFHLTSLLLYAASVALVVWLAGGLLDRARPGAAGNRFGAAVVGGLFAAHPLHVESVAWVSERKDVLYGFFFLLSLLLYLARCAAAGAPARRRLYLLCLGSFVLASLSKPMSVTLPVVLVILDWAPLGRIRSRADLLRVAVVEKLPFYALSLATAVLAVVSQREWGALDVAHQPLPQRLAGALWAIGFYLWKLCWPFDLSPYVPLERAGGIDLLHGLALALVAAIALAALRLRRRCPGFAAAWAFFFVTLLPVLGIVQVGAQAAADRYLHLAMLGPLLLLGALAARAFEQLRAHAARSALVALALLAAALLGARTLAQIGVWQDSIQLWQHVIALYPDAVTAHYNLSQEHVARGESAEAEAALRRVLEIDPEHALAHNELGRMQLARGLADEAEQHFRAAVASDPTLAVAHYNLAALLEGRGDLDGARPHFEAFVRLAPPAYAEIAAGVTARLEALRRAR